MSVSSPYASQDARTHAEHECEIRYLKRLVERKLKEMIFSEVPPSLTPQHSGTTGSIQTPGGRMTKS